MAFSFRSKTVDFFFTFKDIVITLLNYGTKYFVANLQLVMLNSDDKTFSKGNLI